MRILTLAIVCAFSTVLCSAQQTTPTPELYSAKTISQLRELQTASLSSDYAYRQTGYLSNNIGPRLSGSPQAARAVEYIADEMRKQGFDVRLQKCMVPRWVRGDERASVIEFPGMAAGTSQRMAIAALGGSIATPSSGISAEIVVVSSFEELNALGESKVKGKIVVFNYKFDSELQAAGFGLSAYGNAVGYRFGGAMAAARLGAVAVLVRSAGGSQNRLVHTGSMGYTDGVTKIPGAAISFEDAEMLAWLVNSGPVKVNIVLTPQTLPDVESHNVIADLKGTEKPDEIVIVSGHLDSWDLGTGAIDDASGVAMAMSSLVQIKKLGFKPKRTIRFIAWMNEENGGRGSAAYFEAEKANLQNHFAAIEADLGASRPIGINFAGKPEATNYLGPIQTVLNKQGASMFQIQGGVGADITPLTRAGVPSFAPWFDQRTYFMYHHTEADTFDKIIPRELAEGASFVTVLAYGLANLEQPLPR